MARQNIRLNGNPRVRRFRVDADSVIGKGYLLWKDTSGDNVVARPLSELSWDTNLATTQAAAANAFLGVALTDSAAGEDDDILVDVSPESVWAMQCASATFDDDALIGAADGGSNTLSDQLVDEVDATSKAFGKVEKYVAVADTTVRCRFGSVLEVLNTNAVIG